jgi:hypothetical protein
VTDTGIRPVDVSHSGTPSVDVRATSHGCQRYIAERRPAVKSVGWNIDKFRGRGSQETGRGRGGAPLDGSSYICVCRTLPQIHLGLNLSRQWAKLRLYYSGKCVASLQWMIFDDVCQ